MIPRLGLCCQFVEQPIQFRTTTATSLQRLSLEERRQKLSKLCLANADSLLAALRYCSAHEIGCFRIGSSILPVKTHPVVGYDVRQLPDADLIIETFHACGIFAKTQGLRTVFHPDQYVVLNSPRAEVVERSIQDLEYHAEVAEWVGADVINIHAGGSYGDKPLSLERLARNLDRLSEPVRLRITFENDDKVFTPADLLPFCRAQGVPLVYDVHHHRCLPDGWEVAQATTTAITTWNREPLVHISSPRDGWAGSRCERHHDYIDPTDFPDCWKSLPMTVEIEAKAKELAVARLRNDLGRKWENKPRRSRAKSQVAR